MNTDRTLTRSILGPALITGFLLLIPLAAMQFTDEVDWTLSDFIVAGILLFGTGLTYKLVTRKSGRIAYRVAVGFALLTGLFLIWANLAVGIIGSENNPANMMYFGVIIVGIMGAFIVRFQPMGMAYTMFAMAIAQVLVAVVALITGIHRLPDSSVIEIVGVNGFFFMLFAVSALLFRHAARWTKELNFLVLALFLLAGPTLPVDANQYASDTDNIVLRFAVLGDAEPKPEPIFPNLAGAVDHINRLAESIRLDFALGVGDIPHNGTMAQYEAATAELQRLNMPFYPIMGNEEHGASVERFLKYANRWNRGPIEITSPDYVLEFEFVAFVLASPDLGRDLDDEGIEWILDQLERLHEKPVILVVHAPQVGVYPEGESKGIKLSGFRKVVAQPNLAAVISGDLHMDMDRVEHSKKIGHVHYLHAPALERTKIPDTTHHTPMFRVFTIYADRQVEVETYEVGVAMPLHRHAYRFSLPRID